MTDAHPPWLPTAALVLLSTIWGYTWVLAKQGLAYASPFAFVAERCLGGALALFIALKLLRRPMRLQAPGKVLLIALSQVTAFMTFQTWALVEGGAGKTAVLIFTMPIWTLLMAWPILGERIRGQQWIAALVTLAGLTLIIEPWAFHEHFFSKFLGVMAALSWAVGTILIKHFRARHAIDLLSLTAWQMALGAIPLVALALIVSGQPTNWSMPYLGILIFMSIVSTALGWWLWIYILDRVPAWEASLSVLGTPVIAIVSSRLVMDEDFKLTEIAGIGLIGAGLGLLSLIGWLGARGLRGKQA